jgi:hypothetical protein
MKQVPETFSVPFDEHSMSFYKVINQVDFVPTISYLFGIPIPKNNLGNLLLDLMVDIDGKLLFFGAFNYFDSFHLAFFKYYFSFGKIACITIKCISIIRDITNIMAIV